MRLTSAYRISAYPTLAVALLCAALFAGADWPQFRGPGGTGVSADTGLPLTWSADENVVWKTELPGFGASSPITIGDKILLTCYSGYGLDSDAPGEQANLRHHVVCVDRATGNILWDRQSKPRLPEQEYGQMIALHGYASSTPITDGRVVYAFFGRSGVWARGLDDGAMIWNASVGTKTHDWGSGTSPLLAGNLLIVNASVESGAIVALDKATGKEVWRTDGIEESWSTPALVDLPGGKQELAVSMKGKVLGLDPATGERLWECASVPDYVCPMVVANDGVVYVSGGRKPLTVAIRAGGRGDVSTTHLLWELPKCTKVGSPLYHDGLLYWVDTKAVAYSVDAKTGEVVYQERLDLEGGGDKVYASVVLGDGKLYTVGREGGAVVLAAGREFKLLAKNDLGDRSVFNATPVISNGQLLLRSDRFLYCVGK